MRKMNINNLKGNWTYFELAEGSSYQGFELLGENYGKRIKEIQRKSIFGSSKREVRVGEGFSYLRNIKSFFFPV